MKKTTLALAIAIASLTTVANAALPENTWYTGGKLGWSKFYGTDSQNVPVTTKTSTNQIGGGAFIGYQMNPYLAAELGYDWLGNLSYKDASGDKIGKLKVHGASFTAKLSYPLTFISNDLDIYGRAGAFISTTKWSTSTDETSSYTNVSPTYALGLDYRLNEDFSTRLEYQWVNNLNTRTNIHPDNALLSLGITYNLGSISTPAATELKYVENRYVFKDQVLFDYKKSELREEGKKALDSLVTTLAKLNPDESAIIVIGYTDRIGSKTYNQKLSEKRAKSVMSYLLSKGVPADLVTARGDGQANPVTTADQCNKLKGADLKTCLAPDRRVEIEVKAKTVKEVEVTK